MKIERADDDNNKTNWLTWVLGILITFILVALYVFYTNYDLIYPKAL